MTLRYKVVVTLTGEHYVPCEHHYHVNIMLLVEHYVTMRVLRYQVNITLVGERYITTSATTPGKHYVTR